MDPVCPGTDMNCTGTDVNCTGTDVNCTGTDVNCTGTDVNRAELGLVADLSYRIHWTKSKLSSPLEQGDAGILCKRCRSIDFGDEKFQSIFISSANLLTGCPLLLSVLGQM